MEMMNVLMDFYHRNYSVWHNREINILNSLNIQNTDCQSPVTITKLLAITSVLFLRNILLIYYFGKDWTHWRHFPLVQEWAVNMLFWPGIYLFSSGKSLSSSSICEHRCGKQTWIFPTADYLIQKEAKKDQREELKLTVKYILNSPF